MTTEFTRCAGCDGYECITSCSYPGVEALIASHAQKSAAPSSVTVDAENPIHKEMREDQLDRLRDGAFLARKSRTSPSPVPEMLTVGWMHPQSKWIHAHFEPVKSHCFNDGPPPVSIVTRDQAERIIADQVNRADVAEYKLGIAVNTTHQMLIKRAETAEAKLAEIEKQHDREMEQQITERDNAEEWADKLALAIGGEDIGEHSNMNSPWTNALEIARSAHPVADREAETIERLREALEPSGGTKYAYSGEFKISICQFDEDGNEHFNDHLVPWDTIKQIMKVISTRALSGKEPA